jgi:hypothetical protein
MVSVPFLFIRVRQRIDQTKSLELKSRNYAVSLLHHIHSASPEVEFDGESGLPGMRIAFIQ